MSFAPKAAREDVWEPGDCHAHGRFEWRLPEAGSECGSNEIRKMPIIKGLI